MKRILILTLLLAATLGGFAQIDSTATPDSVYVIPEKKLYDKVKDIVNNVVDSRFTDPKAPRFLFIDQKHQYALGIGGYFRMIGSYEFNGIIPDVRDNGFSVASIPVPNTNYESSEFSLAFNSSLIYLDLLGDNKTLGPFKLHISANFNRSTYALKADRVYLTARGFTIGYASSVFNDDPSKAPQIDGSGPNGSSFLSTVLVQYTWAFAPRWKLAVSLEHPDIDATVPTGIKVGAQRLPVVPAYIQYQWGGGKSHIRLSGIFRPMSYMDTILHTHKTDYGWGVQLSGPIVLSKTFTYYYQLVYGRGIANRIADLSVLNVDMVPDPRDGSALQVLPLYALYTALKVSYTPKLYSSFIYSHARLFSENGYRPPEGYKLSHQLVAALFWDVTSDLQLGLEYNYGHKVVMDNKSGSANRVNLLAQLTF